MNPSLKIVSYGLIKNIISFVNHVCKPKISYQNNSGAGQGCLLIFSFQILQFRLKVVISKTSTLYICTLDFYSLGTETLLKVTKTLLTNL